MHIYKRPRLVLNNNNIIEYIFFVKNKNQNPEDGSGDFNYKKKSTNKNSLSNNERERLNNYRNKTAPNLEKILNAKGNLTLKELNNKKDKHEINKLEKFLNNEKLKTQPNKSSIEEILSKKSNNVDWLKKRINNESYENKLNIGIDNEINQAIKEYRKSENENSRFREGMDNHNNWSDKNYTDINKKRHLDQWNNIIKGNFNKNTNLDNNIKNIKQNDKIDKNNIKLNEIDNNTDTKSNNTNMGGNSQSIKQPIFDDIFHRENYNWKYQKDNEKYLEYIDRNWSKILEMKKRWWCYTKVNMLSDFFIDLWICEIKKNKCDYENLSRNQKIEILVNQCMIDDTWKKMKIISFLGTNSIFILLFYTIIHDKYNNNRNGLVENIIKMYEKSNKPLYSFLYRTINWPSIVLNRLYYRIPIERIIFYSNLNNIRRRLNEFYRIIRRFFR